MNPALVGLNVDNQTTRQSSAPSPLARRGVNLHPPCPDFVATSAKKIEVEQECYSDPSATRLVVHPVGDLGQSILTTSCSHSRIASAVTIKELADSWISWTQASRGSLLKRRSQAWIDLDVVAMKLPEALLPAELVADCRGRHNRGGGLPLHNYQ